MRFQTGSGIAGLSLVLVFTAVGCSKDHGFLHFERNVAPEVAPPPPSNCRCPEGFTQSPDDSRCTRETFAEPLRPSDPQPILIGDTDGSYLSWGMHLADVSRNTNWPLDAFRDARQPPFLIDAAYNPIPLESFSNPFWRERVLGWNRVSISGARAHVEYTKTFCVDIQAEKNYVVFVGSDNSWKLKLNGQLAAECRSDHCFVHGLFMNQAFPAGRTLVELKYQNYGGPGSTWFEVFDNSLAEIRDTQSANGLNIVYSTDRLVGDLWDYTGQICPDGFVYDICSSDKKCRKLETEACKL